jgi:hypothetical protein
VTEPLSGDRVRRIREHDIMEEPRPAIQFVSLQVLLRFAIRLALLSVCAAFSREGFVPAFQVLLVLSGTFCVSVGAIRREAMLGSVLTHWDEAAACGFIGGVAHALY